MKWNAAFNVLYLDAFAKVPQDHVLDQLDHEESDEEYSDCPRDLFAGILRVRDQAIKQFPDDERRSQVEDLPRKREAEHHEHHPSKRAIDRVQLPEEFCHDNASCFSREIQFSKTSKNHSLTVINN